MEFADRFFGISSVIADSVISYIYLPVFLLIIIHTSSKKKEKISIALKAIKWIIISYCFITILSWLFIFLLPNSKNYAFIERATGSYAWAYWLMLFFNCVFPFILLIKRFGKNVYIIFLVSILMNFGWLFERFVIILTSIHRDYLP